MLNRKSSRAEEAEKKLLEEAPGSKVRKMCFGRKRIWLNFQSFSSSSEVVLLEKAVGIWCFEPQTAGIFSSEPAPCSGHGGHTDSSAGSSGRSRPTLCHGTDASAGPLHAVSLLRIQR